MIQINKNKVFLGSIGVLALLYFIMWATLTFSKVEVPHFLNTFGWLMLSLTTLWIGVAFKGFEND